MKSIIFVLVLFNLLFFAFREGVLGNAEHPDAARLQQQLQPERIRVLGKGEAPPPSAAPAASASPAMATEQEAVATAELACRQWLGLSTTEADGLSRLLTERFDGFRQARRAMSGAAGWWVYLPAAASREEAERKVEELAKMGLADYFLMPEDSQDRRAISLGLFSSQAGAKTRLAELQAKGLKTARLSPRNPAAGRQPLFVVEVQGPSEGVGALLAEVAPHLPGHPVRVCP